MDAELFDYDLPDSAVAQQPLEPRDSARLLVDRGRGTAMEHQTVADLPSLVGPGDVVVLNDTGVLDARIKLTRPTGGAAELLLLEPIGDRSEGRWQALLRPSAKVAPGTVLLSRSLEALVEDDLGEGVRLVQLRSTTDLPLAAAIQNDGELPLPPYIHSTLTDPGRYQTIYRESDHRWDGLDPELVDTLQSVAAPTAGLHLTSSVCAGIRAAGAQLLLVRLAVGLGTFRPITATQIEDHQMHSERFSVPSEVVAACRDATRVIAVGTTVVRALESAAVADDPDAFAGRTSLFIHGDYDFNLVDVLVTNFHVPRSSLLVMIDAFIGPRWRELYSTALANGYRFLSFGDAMWLTRKN